MKHPLNKTLCIMANRKQSSGIWKWLLAALLIAAIAVAVLFYIGWFDSNTQVDTPAGDNVEQRYVTEEAGADQPGEADWQNSDGRSPDEIVTEPEMDATVPL